MEHPFGQADSPSNLRGIAGPSRARLQARQSRNSITKPYDRRSILADGTAGRPASTFSSSALSLKSAKSKADRDSVKGGGGVGLLSGLRQAIFSRPLSWLQGTSAAKAAASTSTLPSYAAPMMSAAQRLAASVKATNRPDDIETHANGIAGKSRNIAPPTSNFTTPQPHPIAFNYTPARSPSPARSSASAAIHSHGRQRLSVGPSLQSPKFGGSALGTPGYKRGSSLRPDNSSLSGVGASQSSPSFAFGFGSERRIAGISSAVSAHSQIPFSPLPASTSYNTLPSRSPFAMKRQSLADSSAGGSVMGYDRSPRASGFPLMATPSRSRPTSVFGGDFSRSRAGSVADSRMSTSSQTPRRREWSSLKMAPPKADLSAGEELMQEYLAMRNGADSRNSASHPALQNGLGTDTLMMEFGAGPSSLSRQSEQFGEAPLKRGVSMSIDGDESMSELGPRKRQKQMVWDSELGFVSKEDQRASRPAKPVAQNEAERLLNALEGLRSPVAGPSARLSSRGQTPLRQMMPVSVPLPVPERSDSLSGARQGKVEDLSKAVSPYSRAMRSKMSQSVEPEEGKGLKSRLRRPVVGSKKLGRNEEPTENGAMDDESMNGGDSDDENTSMGSEKGAEAEEEEEVVEPPRRKLAIPRGSEIEQEKRTLRSGKVLPPSPAKRGGASVMSPSKLGSSSTTPTKPLSKARLEISASGASAANRNKAAQQPIQPASPQKAALQPHSEGSLFQVRSETTMERSRSSLRQGAEKTHRTHGKSGRIGLDDDDDDEVDDLPSAEELKKIKLPTNLFPQGFTFSGSASPLQGSNSISPAPSKETSGFVLKALPASADGAKQQISEETSFKQKEEAPPAGGSLLGRLGGFAPASQTSTETAKSTAPLFSSTAPTATSELPPPASKPLFSFQSSSKAPASDFFSAPPAAEKQPAQTVSTPSDQRKDGPVPNFFASSLAKSASQDGSNTITAPKSSTSFSFTKQAEVKAPEGNTAPATSSPFSFGAPSNTAPSGDSTTPALSQPSPFGKPAETPTAAPSFSFKPNAASKESPVTFQGFGKPTESAKDINAATPPAFGGFGAKPAETTSVSAPSFSFGATSATASTSTPSSGFSADTSKKREAEEQTGGPAKKSNGFTPPTSFGFNGSNAKSDGFSFNAPKSDNKEPASATSSFGSPFQFKAPTASTEPKPAEAPQTGGFSFGGANKPEMMDTSPSSSAPNGTNAASANMFGTSSPTPAPSKPAFSFGAPATSSTPTSSAAPSASQGGFSFGQSAAKPSSTPAAAPSFTFGGTSQPAPNSGSGNLFGQPTAAPTSNPFGPAATTPSTGGFGGFGAANNTADANRQGSSAPFAFGAPSTQPSTGGFGGFGQNNTTAQSMAGSTSSTPAFAFGGQSAASAPTTPGGGNNSGFSFNMSNVNGGGSNSFAMPASGAASSQPAPFVFGSTSGTSTPPQTSQGGGGFNFNMNSAPQSPVGGASTLFNMGSAPPPGSGGNRPMRQMPARRKR